MAFFGTAALLLLLLGTFVGFELYLHLFIGVSLSHQTGYLRLPPSATVLADATNDIAIKLKGRIDAEVPFNQTVALPLHGTYPADVALDTMVPVKFVIHYQGEVPVESSVALNGTTELVTQKHWYLPSFPLKADIPIRFNVPVSLAVPVDTQIRFVYQGPMQVTFNQTVTAPINTVLKTHLMVDKEVSTPIQASFGLKLSPSQTPLPIMLDHSDLHFSLANLRLKVAS